jgi:pimeloyl-ACP methyl ester carboxylesterase
VILGHGFPELWYSWRHQLPALAEAGYHAVAFDQRGYGDSGKPSAIEDYDITNLSDDLIGILDAVGDERAVFVGHDWGAPPVWAAAQRYPERMAGVVAMSVAHGPRSSGPPIATFKAIFGDMFFYILYFQEPGVAEAELDPQAERFQRAFLYTISGDAIPGAWKSQPAAGHGLLDSLTEPDQLPPWLTDEDIATFSETFTKTGYRGGLNFYRNFDRNWEQSVDWDANLIETPTIFVAGEKDPVLLMRPPDAMAELVPGLERTVIIPGAGHWIQQERPAEVNATLLDFLTEVT